MSLDASNERGRYLSLRPCNHFWQRKGDGRKNRFGVTPTIFAALPHLLPPLPWRTCAHTYTYVHPRGRTYYFATLSTSPCSRARDLFISDETGARSNFYYVATNEEAKKILRASSLGKCTSDIAGIDKDNISRSVRKSVVLITPPCFRCGR